MHRIIIHLTGTKPVKNFKSISELQSYSDSIQNNVLNLLNTLDYDTNTTRLCALNCIVASIDDCDLIKLLNHTDVINIEYDKQILLDDKFESEFSDNQVKSRSINTIYSNWGLDQISTNNINSKGDNVLVCNIDTGVDFSHDALKDNYSGYFKDFVNSRTEPYDDNGHGTHTMGIICGKCVNDIDIGVAPNAQWMSVKAMNSSGTSSFAILAQALEWCYTYADKKPDIISNSWGTMTDSSLIRNAIKGCIDAGICLVSSTGNSGPDGQGLYPSLYNGVFSVGSSNKDNKVSLFSTRGQHVDCVCPGESILSSYSGNRYAYMTGTSMSCPHIAGVIALMISAKKDHNKENNLDKIFDTIKYTCTDIEQVGFDEKSGNGLANAFEAVNKFIDTTQEIKDDFSSSDFNGGIGWLTNNWQIVGNVIVQGQVARCKKHNSFMVRLADLTNKKNISFWTRKTNWYSYSSVWGRSETGEWVKLWQNRHANGTTNPQNISISIPNILLGSKILLSFDHYDYYYNHYKYNWLKGETHYDNILIN